MMTVKAAIHHRYPRWLLHNRHAIIGLAAVTVIAIAIASQPRTKTLTDVTTVFASFSQIGSLRIGAPVYMSGLRIGTVLDLRLDQKRPTTVIGLETDLAIPADSSASIRTDGLFGVKYIGLEAGGALTYLSHGDSIEYTESAIELGTVLDLIIAKGERSKDLRP